MKRTLQILSFSCLLAASAEAQQRGLTFTVDWKGPLLAQTASGPGGNRINEADVLTFGPNAPGFAPLANPSLAYTGDQLGISQYSNCVNHLPFTPCGIEVDAMSQGTDGLLVAAFGLSGRPLGAFDDIWFSVDEQANGAPGVGTSPNVGSESFVADASADVFVVYGLGVGPIGPAGPAGANVGTFDGNGAASAQPVGSLYPGVGLAEPNPPGVTPPLGDNLDSLDIDALLGFPPTGAFYSLDGSFTDPATGIVNSGSAALQGVSSGAVLFVATPGGTPGVYAPALTLGLDMLGPNTDDIDALSIAENGLPGFQPSMAPYDWMTGTTDMVLFSVRRGSAVIGSPDSIFGAPIEPGDILTTPLPTAVGGVSPFPGILFSAESLGLSTNRTNQVMFGDDLNALDVTTTACFDCNNNGVEDAVDISLGTSSDVNGNGVPDECEKIKEYCYCPGPGAACGNSSVSTGCGNSVSFGGHLFFTGTSSVGSDDLELHTDGLPPNKFGLYYMGPNQVSVTIGDGVRCVGGSTNRYSVASSGAGGLIEMGPGIVADSCASFPASGCIGAGDTWNFQLWYRDPAGPCGGGFNWSNGIEVQFLP